MASFTNNKEEKVDVSEEFIDRAVEMYEELKKLSPSGRVSWVKLKKLMRSEGHNQAESNESFRQMLKRERARRGVLPSAEKHADLVAEGKLNAIDMEIGEWRVSQREARDEYLKLNKLKRELIRENQVLKIMDNRLSEVDFSNIEFKPFVVNGLGKKKLIVCLSDIHYGSIVNVNGNYFDTSVAYELIMEYLDRVLEIAEDNNVEEIHVVGMGDYIEHATMRTQNAYSAEAHWSDQVIDISEIIVEFLTKLSKYTKVTYAAIAGNHDRIAGNKNDNLYGDSAINISNHFINAATRTNERITYIPTDSYHHIKEVNGFNFLFVHGDQTSIKQADILGKQSVLHGVNFDALFAGHIHHFNMREVGNNKYVVTFGSIKGSDDYSMTLGTSASRSQGVIIVGEDDYEIKKVNL